MKTEKQIEAAFKEGYKEGYRLGADDQSSYSFGSGFGTELSRRTDEQEAWEESDALRDIKQNAKVESPSQ